MLIEWSHRHKGLYTVAEQSALRCNGVTLRRRSLNDSLVSPTSTIRTGAPFSCDFLQKLTRPAGGVPSCWMSRETRLRYWRRYRANLEAYAWEELCRMAVPMLHHCDIPLARFGPFEPAQRYWHGNAPEFDAVAHSVDGQRLLVGEVKWSAKPGKVSDRLSPASTRILPGAADAEIIRVLFIPEAKLDTATAADATLVDAHAVMRVLR